jgi:hypothetical protein
VACKLWWAKGLVEVGLGSPDLDSRLRGNDEDFCRKSCRRSGIYLVFCQWHNAGLPKSVAELIASMVKTALLPSKLVYRRMQLWQELASFQVIQFITNRDAWMYVREDRQAT